MRSLSLLVLLLFAVVVRQSSAQSHREIVKELRALANGTRLRFKSFNELYLTDDNSSNYFWALPRQDWLQDFTIERISNDEVVIRSNRGNYIGHGTSDYAKGAEVPKEWEFLTPVKNADGSWSFVSRWDKWLSAHSNYGPERFFVNFENKNQRCEHWFLEPYIPPAKTPLMQELLTNGAPRRFKSKSNGLYLTDEPSSVYFLAQRLQDWGRLQKWTIVQINDHEVAIKSNRGYHIGHGTSDWAKEAFIANEWEFLTPVKNADGSWSFKSRWNKWLSASSYYGPERYYISFESENNESERWILEPYQQLVKTLMEELLADGAPRRLKAYNELYLSDGEPKLEGAWVFVRGWSGNEKQHWIIEQINENEVAIKSFNGFYLQHSAQLSFARAAMFYADTWELLTPVKNADGTWSFTNRWNKWLSAHKGYVEFVSENKRCEHWTLEPFYS